MKMYYLLLLLYMVNGDAIDLQEVVMINISINRFVKAGKGQRSKDDLEGQRSY